MQLLHRASAKIKFSQRVVVRSLRDRRSQFLSLTASNQKVDKEQVEKLPIGFDAAKTGGVKPKTGRVLAVTKEHKEWQHDPHRKATV